MQPSYIFIASALALLLSACSTAEPAKPQAATAQPAAHHTTPTSKTKPITRIANPASVFCIQQSGKLRMETTPQGTYAMCILPSGQEVEEWEYFRQHRPAAQ